MTIRENLEQMECTNLSPYACLSKNSKGREREEKQCDIRPVFQMCIRDRLDNDLFAFKLFCSIDSLSSIFLNFNDESIKS